MTKLEFVCSDEKATFLLRAARLFDEGVELEPVKRGNWEDLHDKDEWYGEIYKCNLCGGLSIGGDEYCARCGAKMDGEKEY